MLSVLRTRLLVYTGYGLSAVVIWLVLCVNGWTGSQDDDSHGAVYELKQWDCALGDDRAVVRGKWRVRILNRRGETHATVGMREGPFVRLKKLKARRLGSEGREEVVLDKGDFTKACGYGSFHVYQDNCSYHADLGSVRFPYTVEVEYEQEIKSLFAWKGKGFQEYVPVRRAEYSLTVDGDTPFRYRIKGADLDPEIDTVDGRTHYLWALDSIPALKTWDWVPPWENEPIALELCADLFKLGDYEYEGSSWEAIGRWYHELCLDRGLPQDAAAEAGEPPSARALLESIYADVQKSIRYVAISIGIGGWQPHTAESTLEHGYGDCKDMSNLLSSRLRNAGIEAWPALILIRSEGRTDTTFPSFDFNHVITMAVIGEDTVWMDPTSDRCPAGELPVGDQDCAVLVATDEGGRLLRTPAAGFSDNVTERISRWTLRADLTAALECELRVVGAYARSLRASLAGLDKDEERRLVERQFREAGKKYTVDTYSIENVDEIDRSLIVRVSGQTLRPARKLRGAVYCGPLVMAGLGSIAQTDLEGRPVSLNLVYPETVIDRATVVWDGTIGVDSVAPPPDDSLGYSFGYLSIASEQFADSAIIRLCRADYRYTIDTSAFTEFREYQKAARKIFDSHLKLYAD